MSVPDPSRRWLVEPLEPAEAPALGALARAAKAALGYTPGQLDAWREAWTVPPRRVATEAVYGVRAAVPEAVGGLLGWYGYAPTTAATVVLEDLWVAPGAHGLGLGRLLIEDFLAGATQAGYRDVRVAAEPSAEGFYAHFGFRRLPGPGQPSTAPGLPADRALPLLERPLHPVPGTLTGERVTLVPAVPADRRHFWLWLAHSNLTDRFLGPPRFPETPAPDWATFRADYDDAHFGGADPLGPRSYRIEHEHAPVGHIGHGLVTAAATAEGGAGDPVELDLWMADARLTRRGYGTDAIRTLCAGLRRAHGCRRFLLAPSRRNDAALRVFGKLGFREAAPPAWFRPDYPDAVPLLAEWPLTSF